MAINPLVKQLASKVRNAIYGSEVRESIAKSMEVTNELTEDTKTRQDNVESQWQSVIDETTGKDVISAPEILASRVGEDGTPHANLKARLDDEQQKTTAQLAQTNNETNAKIGTTNARIDTLLVESGGTDAEVVDSRFSNAKGAVYDTLSNRLDDSESFLFKGNQVIPLTWEEGTIQGDNGIDYASPLSYRSKEKIKPEKSIKITTKNGIKYRVVYYPNGVFSERSELFEQNTLLPHVLGMEYRFVADTKEVSEAKTIVVTEYQESDLLTNTPTGELLIDKINFLYGQQKKHILSWQTGTIDDTNGKSTASALSINTLSFIQLTQDMEIKIPSEFDCRVVYYPNGVYSHRGEQFKNSKKLEKDLNMYIRIICSKDSILVSDGNKLSLKNWYPPVSELESKEFTRLKTIGFNVGLYGNGSVFGHPNDENIDTSIASWRAFFAEEKPDLIITQEDRNFFDVNNTLPVPKTIFKPYEYSALTPFEGYQKQQAFSHYPITNVDNKELTNVPGEGLVPRRTKFTLNVDGKEIECISSHLSLGVENEAIRQAQMQEVLDEVKGATRFIISLDSNIEDESEYELFNAYNKSNAGYFGSFMTSQNSGKARDIIVTNMEIESSYMPSFDLSDHYPMVADIIVR